MDRSPLHREHLAYKRLTLFRIWFVINRWFHFQQSFPPSQIVWEQSFKKPTWGACAFSIIKHVSHELPLFIENAYFVPHNIARSRSDRPCLVKSLWIEWERLRLFLINNTTHGDRRIDIFSLNSNGIIITIIGISKPNSEKVKGVISQIVTETIANATRVEYSSRKRFNVARKTRGIRGANVCGLKRTHMIGWIIGRKHPDDVTK